MLHCNVIFVYIYVYTVHNSDKKILLRNIILYTINLFVSDISLQKICVSSNVIGLNIFPETNEARQRMQETRQCVGNVESVVVIWNLLSSKW